MKFFNKKLLGYATTFTVPGMVQVAVTHPFEHAQMSRADLPKYIKIKDSTGKVIKVKENPKRFGKVLGFKYDKGDYKQHMMARIPKGVLSSAAIFGTMAGLTRGMKMPVLKY